MYALKNFLSKTGVILLCLAALVALYFTAAFCLSRITVPAEKSADPKEIAIYIKTNGAHTDIVLPVRNNQMDWSREIKYENIASSDTVYPYLAIGWGDKGFYLETPTWAELKPSVAFKAAFWLSTAAMHATYYKSMTEDDRCKKITVSKKQYAELVSYITQWFQKDAGGHFINIKTTANYGETDAFYEAKGRYSLFFTCNTWANSTLKACGQKGCVWTIFDTGIFRQYE
jgi:uncharacterized protein (TIGR02117 family)